ncbi:family 16 glycoside hydrolase [Methylocaldum sp. RMAD-M]|uniref:family 16 glycoside hydrolase n=1 Tax=Methylocaldum sp. RMAD-M TaxID=2806557 RepID=UPI00197B5C1D|nr:family 16 glycoside hydrolase [Methylocaldum sp. RMAD-M]MBP1150855.1 hypothetical protein [Methylocaldum sp. RMAD-M]
MATKQLIHLAVCLGLCTFTGLVSAEEKAATSPAVSGLSFDELTPGGIPPGWTIAATNPGGPPAEWQVKADPKAPSAPHVLAITKIHDDSGDVFNLCWTNAVKFRDGAIEVSLRADGGKEDQGDGLIWRVQDANNYYVARYNPLEDNIRLYFVKDGRRKQLDSANISGVKSGEWFRLKIVQQGDKIEAYLNDRKYLETTDRTFMKAGGIGFWSKADAASSFDDLVVTAR